MAIVFSHHVECPKAPSELACGSPKTIQFIEEKQDIPTKSNTRQKPLDIKFRKRKKKQETRQSDWLHHFDIRLTNELWAIGVWQI